eukprot:1157241-Pelagomonas_calceolata.AAC.2
MALHGVARRPRGVSGQCSPSTPATCKLRRRTVLLSKCVCAFCHIAQGVMSLDRYKRLLRVTTRHIRAQNSRLLQHFCLLKFVRQNPDHFVKGCHSTLCPRTKALKTA